MTNGRRPARGGGTRPTDAQVISGTILGIASMFAHGKHCALIGAAVVVIVKHNFERAWQRALAEQPPLCANDNGYGKITSERVLWDRWDCEAVHREKRIGEP